MKYLKNVDKAELLSIIEEPQLEEKVVNRLNNWQGQQGQQEQNESVKN